MAPVRIQSISYARLGTHDGVDQRGRICPSPPRARRHDDPNHGSVRCAVGPVSNPLQTGSGAGQSMTRLVGGKGVGWVKRSADPTHLGASLGLRLRLDPTYVAT